VNVSGSAALSPYKNPAMKRVSANRDGRLPLHTRAATNYSLIVFPKNSLSLQAWLYQRLPSPIGCGIQRSGIAIPMS
jgi:hypothetical protein